MKKLIIATLLLCTGCWNALGTTDIQCWFASSVTQTYGEPWFQLIGRTDKWHTDERGPLFKTKQELEAFMDSHNLKLCGSK